MERKPLFPFLSERVGEAKEESILFPSLSYALTHPSPKGRGSLPTNACHIGLNRSAIANQICCSVSSQKPMNVRVVRVAERFVRAAEDYPSVAYHQDFTVNQAKLLAFLFENYVTGFVDHCVFRGQVI